MFANYSVRPLSPERIPEAFPVVASLDEEITPRRWSDYASAIVGRNGRGGGQGERRGILTLEDRLGRIVGLCAYDVRPDLHRNRVLVIENFAVVTLIGAPRAAAELLAAMEQLARDRACRCLAVSLLGRRVRRSPNRDRGRTGRFFKGAGFRLDLAQLCKCFDPAPAETFETAGAIGRPGSPGPRP